MKSRSMNLVVVVLAAILCLTTFGQAQYVPPSPPQNVGAVNAAAGPAGAVSTVSGFTIAVTPGPIYCLGDVAIIHNTQFTLQPSQTYQLAYSCLTDQLYVRTGAAIQGADILLATVVTNTTTIASTTDLRVAGQFPTVTDYVYNVPLGGGVGGCGLSATTGVLGTAAAGTTNPGVLRFAANGTVYELITTAATNVIALNCDLTPPSKFTTGKGVIVNNVQIFYGVQTTALTSITAPTVTTLTYPATGGAAAISNVTAGGALTVTPVSLQLTTTTSGQCFSENVALGTPVALNTDLQRLTLEQLFNQSAAAATQLQICGVLVHYTLIPL